MRILFVCLQLLVLSAALLSKRASIESGYEKFKRQHIYKEMSGGMCDRVMQERKINPIKTRTCKKINTFIKADIETVKSICVNGGEPYGDMTKSRKGFDVVVCNLTTAKATSKKCHYVGKKLKNKKIIIKCEVEHYPVHYDKTLPIVSD